MEKEHRAKICRKALSKRDGKIAGQNMRKDTATTLLFKARNENFAELFNRTLFTENPILPDELYDEDIKETAYLRITDGGGTSLVQYRDVVKGARSGKILAVLGVENQSEIDYSMPFRILEVDFLNYARQVRLIQEKHDAEWRDGEGHIHRPETVTAGEYMGKFLKSDRLTRCVTLVVYWGEKPWDGPRKLSELFGDSADDVRTVQLDMNFLDVCRMTEEEICGYTSELRTVFGFTKYARDKDKLREFMNDNIKYYNNVSETALNAMEELTHSPELRSIRVSKYETGEGGFNVCQGIREMINDGREEGLREGIKEGELKAKRETAWELSDMGLSVNKIAQAVKASEESVAEWLAARRSLYA